MTAPLPKYNKVENEDKENYNEKDEQSSIQAGDMDTKTEQVSSSCLSLNDESDDDHDSSGSSSVQVAVRVRPFLQNETGASTCIDYKSSQQALRIGGTEGPTFAFDHVLPEITSQKELYSSCVVPLVRACLKGYNATVFAYGQTGSGKTHTIVGPSIQQEISASNSKDSTFSSSASSGMIPRAFQDLFHYLSKKKTEMCDSYNEDTSSSQTKQPPYEYEVRIQFLEIYGEEIRDLLAPSSSDTRLTIRDGAAGVEPEVIGASEVTVHSTKEALLCLQKGTLRRVTAATQMNSTSSRSHAMMSVTVEQRTLRKTSFRGKENESNADNEDIDIDSNDNDIDNDSDSNDKNEVDTEEEVKRSKFHFVDLAGSERQKRTKAEGKRLKEGIDINKGLLVLGNVISALGDSKKVRRTHVPYRDSKLTRLLKGSLGGNHKTLMIACVSPASINMEESLNCLRYANRAKNIKNNAVVNLDAGSRLVADLRGKCKDLARELLRVRDLCKNDNVEQIVVNVEAGSTYTEKLLLDLVAGKDIEVSSDSLKTLPTNEKKKDVDSAFKNIDEREAFKRIEMDLFQILDQSGGSDMLKEIEDKSSQPSFVEPLDGLSELRVSEVGDIDKYKNRVTERKAELDLMRQSSIKAREQLLMLKEQHEAESAAEENSILLSSTDSLNDEYIAADNDDSSEFPEEFTACEDTFNNAENSPTEKSAADLNGMDESKKTENESLQENHAESRAIRESSLLSDEDIVTHDTEENSRIKNGNEAIDAAQAIVEEKKSDLLVTSTRNIFIDRNHDENTHYTDITFDHTELDNKSVVSRDIYEEKVASYEKELALLRQTIVENERKLSLLSNSDSKLAEVKETKDEIDLEQPTEEKDLTPKKSNDKENLKESAEKDDIKLIARVSDHPLVSSTNICRNETSSSKIAQKSEKEKKEEKSRMRLQNKQKIERDLMVLSLYMSPLLDF